MVPVSGVPAEKNELVFARGGAAAGTGKVGATYSFRPLRDGAQQLVASMMVSLPGRAVGECYPPEEGCDNSFGVRCFVFKACLRRGCCIQRTPPYLRPYGV